MALAAAPSLFLPSLTPKTLTLTLCKSTSPSQSLISRSFSPLRLHAATPSLSRSFLFPGDRSSARSALSVAVSSELSQGEGEGEEEAFGEDDGDQQSFSPDLQLYVGNLPFSVDSSILAGLFQQAGNVQMVEVIYDKITQRSRGFGFVTMSTPEEVEAAARQFNGYELEGRALRVNFGPPPSRRENQYPGTSRGSASFDDANRVYVGNLAWGVDDLALKTLFSEQGTVREARVVYDRESGRSRGFGFVTYSSAEEVSSAVESLNGANLDGRPIRVSVAEGRTRRQF